MRGKPSAVRRDETILVGDTIVYDDSTKLVIATGDTVILRDPSSEEADDFVARGNIRYDLGTGEGTTSAFSFAATLNAPFLKSAIVPSTERVPSGKNSTEQSF